jgi:hypothetical protein
MTPEERAKFEAVIAALAPSTQWALLVALERFQDGAVSLTDALEGVRQAVAHDKIAVAI